MLHRIYMHLCPPRSFAGLDSFHAPMRAIAILRALRISMLRAVVAAWIMIIIVRVHRRDGDNDVMWQCSFGVRHGAIRLSGRSFGLRFLFRQGRGPHLAVHQYEVEENERNTNTKEHRQGVQHPIVGHGEVE